MFVKLIYLVDALQQEDLQLTTECYCNLIREKKEIVINCGSVMFFVGLSKFCSDNLNIDCIISKIRITVLSRGVGVRGKFPD